MKANIGKVVAKCTVILLVTATNREIKRITFLLTANEKKIGTRRQPIVLSKKLYDFIIND